MSTFTASPSIPGLPRSVSEPGPHNLVVSSWRERDEEGAPSVPWLKPFINDLQRLSRPHDSSGPKMPVATSAVVATVRLLTAVMSRDTAPPAIVPRFNGGLQLEWHMCEVDLEISIDPDGTASAWCEHASGREWEDEASINFTRLKKELSLLINK